MKPKIEVASYKGRRCPRWFQALVALLLASMLTFGVLFGLVMRGSYDRIQGEPEVMIVLGCQVKPWGPSILLQDRLDEALGYLADHTDMMVVVSGGQGADEPSTEARAMADYLVEKGISEEQIMLEEESHNTVQNLRYSYRLLEQEGYNLGNTEVLIVSNGFHLTRVRMLAERVGFAEVSTLAAPSSHWPSRLKMYIREPLALIKSAILDC